MIINHYLELAYKYSDYTDKIKYQGDYANGHTYPIIYDKLFSQYKNRDVNFLEIGLNFGGNVALVCDYFDQVHVDGIDIADTVKYEISPKLKTHFTFHHGSFDNKNILENISKKQYDIILEDGSHRLDHQLKSIELYLPLLKPDGVMIIEDIQEAEYLSQLYNKVDTNKYYCYAIDLRYNKMRWDDLILVIENRLT
jgi:cephalosporin hydroxylase